MEDAHSENENESMLDKVEDNYDSEGSEDSEDSEYSEGPFSSPKADVGRS